MGPNPVDLGGSMQAQCPAKRLTADRGIQTLRVGVQMRTPTRHPATGIGNENALDGHDTQ